MCGASLLFLYRAGRRVIALFGENMMKNATRQASRTLFTASWHHRESHLRYVVLVRAVPTTFDTPGPHRSPHCGPPHARPRREIAALSMWPLSLLVNRHQDPRILAMNHIGEAQIFEAYGCIERNERLLADEEHARHGAQALDVMQVAGEHPSGNACPAFRLVHHDRVYAQCRAFWFVD